MYEKFLIIGKKTRWELDLQKYRCEQTVKKIYKKQNNNYSYIYSSHLRQKANIQKTREMMPSATFTTLTEISKFDLHKFQFIVSLGGDNHFVHVAHQIFDYDHLRIFGVNSDPLTSTGVLLYFDIASFLSFIDTQNEEKKSFQKQNQPQYEYWSQISGKMTLLCTDEIKNIKHAISEVSIHSKNGDTICRLLAKKDPDDWEDIKCTGILLATGAGSSGWYSNCFYDSKNHIFAKNADFFHSIVREPPFAQRNKIRNLSLKITRNKKLDIISKVDAMIVIDSHPEYSYPFPPGTEVSFQLSDKKLTVVRPEKNSGDK